MSFLLSFARIAPLAGAALSGAPTMPVAPRVRPQPTKAVGQGVCIARTG